jgi:ABC-type nitrate/sulfonate/bicarbonate transport system ATPase subunit
LIEEAILLADRIAIMQQGKLRNIIAVNLKRPRNDESKEFLKILDEVKKSLGES